MHRTSILKPLSLIKWKASFKKWELCAALVLLKGSFLDEAEAQNHIKLVVINLNSLCFP